MDKILIANDSEVHYSVLGTGPAVVLLHGYMESREIWEDFLTRLCEQNTVIVLDIPGHGRSGTFAQKHTMEAMAEVVKQVIIAENQEQVVLLGHSMGGYITMEFVARYPQMLRGFILFHSTCFADNEEKRTNREREISLIKCGKMMQIVHTNIPKAFADENIDRMHDQVSRLKEIAARSPHEGVIALLRGMKTRADHSATFRNTTVPAMVVWGRKDNYIPESVYRSLKSINPDAHQLILEQSGHMGFLEEMDRSLEAVQSFMNSIQ